MIQRGCVGVALVTLGVVFFAGLAEAQNAVNIGGRKSVTGLFSVVSSNPDEGDSLDTLLLGGNVAYTTLDARWELAASLTIAGFFSDDFEAAFYVPSIEARINSDPLGAEENIIVYAGAVAGAGIVRSDDFDDDLGVFGPKIGAEFYFSPRTAVQIQDRLLVDTESGVSNTFSVGFKLLLD
ncbi:MAG: hypothetical protein AB8G23_18230 [Myxococcota bacterium]